MADTQTKQQMMKANQLIDQKRYTEARKLLVSVNHPTAKQWVDKIDSMQPAKKPSSGIGPLMILLIVLGMLASAVIGAAVYSLVVASQSDTSIDIASMNPDEAVNVEQFIAFVTDCVNLADGIVPRYGFAEGFLDSLAEVSSTLVVFDLYDVYINASLNRIGLELCLYGDDEWQEDVAEFYRPMAEMNYPYMYQRYQP